MTNRGELDPGLEAVNALYGKLMVDDEWAIRSPRGFEWWGYRLAQRIWADPTEDFDGRIVSCVHVESDVVEVDESEPYESLLPLINAANVECTMSALVVSRERSSIVSHATAYIHEGNIPWIIDVLSLGAILQNVAAHIASDDLATVVGVFPATSEHPTSGERAIIDDILNVPANLVVPAGQRPSAFAGQDIVTLRSLADPPWVLALGDSRDEFTAEFPFTDSTPASYRAMLPHLDDGSELGTALLQIFTNAPHPRLGSGALMVTELPITLNETQTLSAAEALNAIATGWTDAPLLGSWTRHPQRDSLAFVSFLPSMLRQPGLLENFVWYALRQCQLARAWFEQ